MATLKQKKAFAIILENPDKPKAISRVMREVGYSENTAVDPANLTNSKGWKELMDEYLPDMLLVKVHLEGLEAVRREQIRKNIYKDVPDMPTRHKYLDSGYKLKGHYAPEQLETVNKTIIAITYINPDERDDIAKADEKAA